MIHHIKLATRHLIFWSLVTTALGLTGVRLVLSGIDAYKASLAGQISEIIGAPVTIGRLGAKMRRFSPELILKDIAVASVAAENPAIALKEIRLGVNLLDMLVNRELLPSAWVTLVGAELSVQRKADGSFAIVGLKAGDGQPLWLFEGSKFEVLQSEISWQDELGKKAPLKFASVDIAIINAAGHHRINMLAKLPKQYGDTLTLSADFSGNPFAASALDGVVFIDGKNLQLGRWPAADLPLTMTIQSGAGDLKIWSRLQHSQPVSVNAEAWLRDIKLLRQDKRAFALKSLHTGFHWRLDEGVDDSKQWRLDVRRFLLQTAEHSNIIKKWPDVVFSLSGRGNDESMLQQIALSIVQIDLQEISRIALFFAPIPDDIAATLAQADINGSLKPFALFADLHEKTIAVDGRFTGLGYAPFLTIPGIQNLSGRINGSDKQGVVHFSTKEARLASPALFREALVIKSLDGAVHWLQQDDKWRLSSSRINLDLLGLQSESRLRVNFPKNHERPFVDMQTDLVCDDVSQLKHYFPTGVMRPVDTSWLDRAFVSGRVEKGRLSYYGELGSLAVLTHNPAPPKAAKALAALRPDIPPGMEGVYRVLSTEMTGGGLFEALLDVRRLELDYAPGWPRINDIAGELLFLQDRMEVNVYQGYSNKLKAGKTVIINEAIGKSKKLSVQGEVEGEIVDALGFLQQTPLNSRVGSLIDAIVPQGNTRIALDLLIPLNKEVEPKVDGSAELNKAGLTVKSVDLVINSIDGLLKFNEQGIYSDTIHAAAFKRPIRIDVDNADNETLIHVSGSAEVGDIEKQFGLPDWEVADGTMNYRLKLTLPDEHLGSRGSGKAAGKTPELAVDSDLAGVAMRLPGALAKTRIETKPLSMVFSLGEKSLLPMAIRYDDKLKAAIRFDTAKQRIDSGHVLLGKGEAAQSADAGLKLEINRDPLDLKDWLTLSGAGDGQAGVNIREIKIHSDHALWGNTPLGVFDMALKPDGGYWAGRINSAFARGTVHIPVLMRDGRIRLDMDLLDLSAIKRLKSQNDAQQVGPPPEPPLDDAVDMENVPLFEIRSNKTLWESVDLGLLSLQTERIPHGIALKKLELSGLAQKLDLTGTWRRNAMHTETSLQGRLTMPNTGALLTQLGITGDLSEAAGAADFSVHWPAAPHQFTLAALQGEVDIHFSDGRLLSIEPGFGRILGVLAMAQWTKRLQLDFRDIYEAGLMFNSINGHFILSNGKASTQDLVVDAIPAKITIAGDTDLVNKTVDQLVNVAPKGADAVPIAGTIMGKITALIARTVTGEDQDGLFLGSQYRVKGQWGALQIIPLHDHDGLLQKTWTGITGFPWLQQP